MPPTTPRPAYEKYQYAGLAGNLYNSKESKRFAPGALEVLAGAKGLNLGEEALGFVRGTQASEKGIETAISIYQAKFEEERGKLKPSELLPWYNPVLAGLEDSEKNKIVSAFTKYDETIKSIKDKYNKAAYTASDEAPKGFFTDEQIAQAKEIMKKYENVILIMYALDIYKYEGLRPDAVNASRIQELKGLASKL